MAADADFIEKLRPIRLPAGFEAFDLHGALAVFALALLAGLLLSLFARLVTAPRPSRRREAERAIAEARTLAREERLLAQSRLVLRLKEDDGRRIRNRGSVRRHLDELKLKIDAELYRPDPALDPDALDRAILDALAARR
ncbi:hypothetical protein [Aurantimonas sp. VKM B-3413]|uniref:hypothetical protein n=1 Tax=Aurantimonas sp. VKM B-3413 TaxID=2779401 RepID=UPI001E4A139B|nr:hypothetical protein [Aurantimonas sp. VKM B-3413]MCB8836361.1 hypothetical protein [Aurantimonas sp. VKM B-3413]